MKAVVVLVELESSFKCQILNAVKIYTLLNELTKMSSQKLLFIAIGQFKTETQSLSLQFPVVSYALDWTCWEKGRLWLETEM